MEVLAELNSCRMSAVVVHLAWVWVMAQACVGLQQYTERGGRIAYTRQHRCDHGQTICACPLPGVQAPGLHLPELASFSVQLWLWL